MTSNPKHWWLTYTTAFPFTVLCCSELVHTQRVYWQQYCLVLIPLLSTSHCPPHCYSQQQQIYMGLASSCIPYNTTFHSLVLEWLFAILGKTLSIFTFKRGLFTIHTQWNTGRHFKKNICCLSNEHPWTFLSVYIPVCR